MTPEKLSGDLNPFDPKLSNNLRIPFMYVILKLIVDIAHRQPI